MKACKGWIVGALLLVFFCAAPLQAAETGHVLIPVQAAAGLPAGLSGRLLVFVKKDTGKVDAVDSDMMQIADTWVAARDIDNLNPGQTVLLDADDLAFPKGFSALPPGRYQVQLVLNVGRDYNYGGRKEADWVSDVTVVNWQRNAHMPRMTLARHAEADPRRAATLKDARAKWKPEQIHEEHFTSALVSRFWGSTKQINAWVVLPPGYDDKASVTYPTVYWTHGFGGNFDNSLPAALRMRERMDQGKMPPMIWVMLDESCAQGTHEFADSVNNGPWGAALTTEFIPYLEQHYHMDAKRDSRFLNGHSSGGWATLQLEINYPTIFGGTWSTSPDSSDFHDFTGIDLYAAHANQFRRPSGEAAPLVRMNGKVVATMQQYVQNEAVLGAYGGQFGSFDWVFSPKGDDGAPRPMFNRVTGEVDPKVVAYWRDNYDLANIVQRDWKARGEDLRGRIHVIVGTADTFYLDGAAHRLQGVLDGLQADARFTFLEGRSHFDLYKVGDDRMGLIDQIAAEMYAVARPVAAVH